MTLRNIIPAALCAALCATSCSSNDKSGAEAQDAQKELPIIDISVVTEQSVPQTQQYTATVEAYNLNNISPSTTNRIKTINVEAGDHVSRGQVLVTLDDAALSQLKVNLDQAQRDYDRAVQLLEIGSGTQSTVDSLKSQLDALRTQYRNLQENTVLTSPVSGVVTARNYDPGDMTGQQPVLTVGQINPAVKVLINITENDLASVKTGMPVQLSFDAYPGEEFNGKIARIYPQVDPATRTFQAEVHVANPDSRIFPGMFTRVTLDHGAQMRVVAPDRAIVKQTGSGNNYIYTYSNGTVKYNRVNLGRHLNTGYEIIEGVADGDTVVIAGQTRLADGAQAVLKSATQTQSAQ